MKIPTDLRHLYPDDEGKEGRQCIHWIGSCRNCGDRFKRKMQQTCPRCAIPRERCPMFVVHGRTKGRKGKDFIRSTEDSCRSHNTFRHWGLYSLVADRITNEEWDNAIERVGDGHEQVLAMAQIFLGRALKAALEDPEKYPNALREIERYMNIIEKHVKATRGELVTIAWDDKIARALKKRFRDYIGAIEDSLKARHWECPSCKESRVIPESVRLAIMEDVREATTLLGNTMTVPNATGGEVRFSKPDADSLH